MVKNKMIMKRKRNLNPFEAEEWNSFRRGIDVEEVFGEDYKAEQVIMQIRKVVDSIGNPAALNWVTTDKGGKVWIGHKNAKLLLVFFDLCTNRSSQDTGYVSNRQRPELIAAQNRAKTELTEKLQTAKGLKELVKFVKENASAIINPKGSI